MSALQQRVPDTPAFNLAAWMAPQLLRVEQALSHWVAADAPAGLGEAMRYAVLDGGKRLRPLLVLAAREALAPADGAVRSAVLDDAALRSACAVELIHAYSLVHDDMPCMDNDVLRRGKPTVHVQFGEARALLAGDAASGVCIMQMEAGLDTGPVLLRGAFPIAPDDTSVTLHDRLAALGAQLIVAALGKLPLPAESQPTEGVTYAHKIEKAEALIDWTKRAIELDRHLRAFNPFPGAQAVFAGQTVKLWRATPVEASGEIGQILAVDRSTIVVACGEGALAISELQKAGGKRLPVQQFLAGHPLKVGDRFDLPA